MIKNLVILMTLGLVGAVWASEPVTVQVINAVYEKSITQEFDTRLKKTGLKIHKKVENGRYIVTLGTFKDTKSAQNALKKAQVLVVKDAFIRPVNRHYTVADSKAKGQHTVHQEVVTTTEYNAVSSNGSVAHSSVPAATTSAAATPAVASVGIAPAATTTSTSSTKLIVVSDCDRREMHKDEIAEAIQYYRTSPYHRFEPVLLQR